MEEFTLLEVLEDRVIIVRIPDEEKIGSLWVPDQAKIANTEGYIVALGQGLTSDQSARDYCPVAVGDRVLFSRYAGVQFNYGGRSDYKEMVILRLADIHGIFREEVGDKPVFKETQPEWKV